MSQYGHLLGVFNHLLALAHKNIGATTQALPCHTDKS